ncbi:yemanuclein-like [Teleopsis dalmanni]|uniref:yemanuclein-like n=1 Tax=Teleopsis dalmanni TaxID=139649 RepID=UPI0018CF7A61|nr:yemanuclein-like [Teleopsis dalmanni]
MDNWDSESGSSETSQFELDFVDLCSNAYSNKNNEGKTVRFNVDLFSNDNSNYSIFNYVELMAFQEKEESKSKDECASDTFTRDGAAQKANKVNKKKTKTDNKKNKTQNRNDIGFGYDANDSFIDNSEKYDEFVPEDLDTCHRGLYINKGLLIYKKVGTICNKTNVKVTIDSELQLMKVRRSQRRTQCSVSRF